MANIQKKDLKKYLNRVFVLTKLKNNLVREYNQKKKDMDSISICLEGIKTNTHISKVENKALELLKLEENINFYSDEINKARCEILDIINYLEDERYKQLIRLRYLDFKKWDDIACILGYSNKHIYKLHNKVLQKLI